MLAPVSAHCCAPLSCSAEPLRPVVHAAPPTSVASLPEASSPATVPEPSSNGQKPTPVSPGVPGGNEGGSLASRDAAMTAWLA